MSYDIYYRSYLFLIPLSNLRQQKSIKQMMKSERNNQSADKY